MNVIIVADHAFINGGQAKVAIESALGLAGRGNRVVFFAAVGPADPRMEAAGIDVIVLGQTDVALTTSLASFGVQWLWNRPAALRLQLLLSGYEPGDSVVHVHGWAKALSPSIGPVLKATTVPVVFTMHEYYLACPNGGFYDYPISAACHRTPLSSACIAYNCDSRSYARKLMRVGRHALMRGSGLVGSAANVITISRLQKTVLTPYLPKRTRYFEVSNPVDAEPLGRKADRPLGDIVFVGRVSPEKGANVFAEAARIAGQTAVFIGDGPQRGQLERDYPEARFLGWKNPDEVKAVMRSARALVFPSVWYEGQPLTVLESLAAGTPVIVSDICAGREAVEDGVNGLWFASGKPDSLATALTRLSDDAVARRMSDAAYDLFWADPLTLDRHLDGIEAVYRTSLASASRPAKVRAIHA